MKHSKILVLSALVFIGFACKDKSTGYKPNVAGKAGELLVVMDDKIKSSAGGEELQALLQETYLGLPQEEPHFKVAVAPHRSFSSFMKTIRNLVFVKVASDVKENAVKYYHDRWAKPQAMIGITAKDTAALRLLIEEHQLKILSFFNKAERERNIASYKKYPSDELVKLVDATFHVKMNVPNSLSNKRRPIVLFG